MEENIDLIVDHFQIDNMASWDNPVLICPKKVLEKEEAKEEKKGEEDEEYTPFAQISKIIIYQIFI